MTRLPSPRSESGLARTAGILGLGNIASRVIGLARESVLSGFFGASGALSAARIASQVPTMVYDLLIGGVLSAALVPVFSRYTDPEHRAELARIASVVFTLFGCVMGLALLAVELFAVPMAGVLGDFADPALQQVLIDSLRVIAPLLLIFGFTGGAFGLLYALKRFNLTALSSAVFNLGVVLAVPLLSRRVGIYAFPVGIILGGLIQLAVLAIGLRDIKLRVSFAWRHPAVRQILRLYLPIALGLVITQVQVAVDRRWASQAAAQAVSWMEYATRLIQLPLGLVPVAVSLAALPGLSQRAAAADWDGFRGLFGRGLRLVLVLLLPAAAGLWVLAEPMIRLLFEHRSFHPYDTYWTALALRLYLLGLVFAGVDFLLNYTFYARQDTRTPAIVGVVAVGFYFVAAVALKKPLGFLGLVLADSVKQLGHAAIMVILLLRSVGRLRGERIVSTAARCGAAALGMGGAVWLLVRWLSGVVPAGLAGEVILVGAAGAAGAGIYLAALHLLRVPEGDILIGIVTGRAARLVRKSPAN